MKLNRLFKAAIIFCCVTFFTTNNVKANIVTNNTSISIANNEEPSAHAQALLIRLFEIKNMERASLTSADKKALRNELKGMKKEMKASDGLDKRVYLSVGAIIIIILLIILLR